MLIGVLTAISSVNMPLYAKDQQIDSSKQATATKQNSEDFLTQLSRYQMQFDMPVGFETIPTKKNKQLHYKYAIKDTKKEFEVRYAFSPITERQLKQHQACQAKEDCHSMDPNHLYKGMMLAHSRNMTGQKSFRIMQFRPSIVKKWFGADVGLSSSIFEFDADFAEGYKYGQMMILHKDNQVDVTMVFLGNDENSMANNRKAVWKQLRFK